MSTGRAQREKLRVHIRWMIRRDMPEVLKTELASFEFAWTEDDFLRCLRQRNCIGMVAETDERVVGFMIYELHKHRLHILNFAVSPTVRRSGIGNQMLGKLVNKLSTHRRQKITLAVRGEESRRPGILPGARVPCDTRCCEATTKIAARMPSRWSTELARTSPMRWMAGSIGLPSTRKTDPREVVARSEWREKIKLATRKLPGET